MVLNSLSLSPSFSLCRCRLSQDRLFSKSPSHAFQYKYETRFFRTSSLRKACRRRETVTSTSTTIPLSDRTSLRTARFRSRTTEPSSKGKREEGEEERLSEYQAAKVYQRIRCSVLVLAPQRLFIRLLIHLSPDTMCPS